MTADHLALIDDALRSLYADEIVRTGPWGWRQVKYLSTGSHTDTRARRLLHPLGDYVHYASRGKDIGPIKGTLRMIPYCSPSAVAEVPTQSALKGRLSELTNDQAPDLIRNFMALSAGRGSVDLRNAARADPTGRECYLMHPKS